MVDDCVVGKGADGDGADEEDKNVDDDEMIRLKHSVRLDDLQLFVFDWLLYSPLQPVRARKLY